VTAAPLKFCSSIAFKEWAAVCAALAAGRQSIILRKGGIAEGAANFQVAHREFWLYPTHFHQAPEALVPAAADLAQAAWQPPPGEVPLRLAAQVCEVYEIATLEAAHRLAGLHVWSPATVAQRFNYRQPGLFLLLVRVYAAAEPLRVPETTAMAGCKSWVPLPSPASAVVQPVLSDEAFAAAASAVCTALARG
jgi:hypothetical protein